MRESAWHRMSENTGIWDKEAVLAVAPGFLVSVQSHTDRPEKDFPRPAIRLEFSAVINAV